MITASDVRMVLQPWLGSFFMTAHDTLIRRCVDTLNRFVLWQDNAAEQTEQLEAMLTETVFDGTGGSCVLVMDSGRSVQIPAGAYADMADELMYLVYRQMPVSETNWRRLRVFALHNSSLSALRVLMESFAAWMQEDEKNTLAGVIRQNYAPFRWRSWLK